MEVNITEGAGFCEDVFWDTALLWDGETPFLTECFRETILVYIPALFLLISEPVGHWFSKGKTAYSIKISSLFVLRIILCIVLIATTFAELVLSFKSSESVSLVSEVSTLVRGVTYILAWWFHILHHRQGKVTSITLFLFWILALSCALLKLINNFTNNLWEPIPFLTQYTEVPLLFVLFLLSCWSEPSRGYTYNTPGEGTYYILFDHLIFNINH